jgi:hypothetical protein
LQSKGAFAALIGLPLVRLTREPGSAVGWQNLTLPNTSAFVVELPAGSLPASAVGCYANAVVAVGALARFVACPDHGRGVTQLARREVAS